MDGLTVVELHDHKFYLDIANEAEVIQRGFRHGWYERAEVLAAQATIRPMDRVLELGAGMGIVTCALARIVGDAGVLAFEPNAAVAERARRNFALNGRRIDLRERICRPASQASERVRFHLADVFWASRLAADEQVAVEQGTAFVEVDVDPLEAVIEAHGASVLMMDIEGGEIEILRHGDLERLRAIIFETHEASVGGAATNEAIAAACAQGFVSRRLPDAPNVAILERPSF